MAQAGANRGRPVLDCCSGQGVRSVLRHGLWVALVLLFVGQLAYSRSLAPLRPAIEEMPPAFSPVALKALALGDDEYLFRALALWLQDVGDGGGRVRPLREYDYDRVVDWLQDLDALNPRSEYAHTIAARYFGAITDPQAAPSRVAKIGEYFRRLGREHPAADWPWLVWAGVKVQAIARDRELAERLADDLVALKGNPTVPDWLPLIAIRLYQVAGNEAAARSLAMDPDLASVRSRYVRNLSESLNP
jgi:hypothetical protein